MPSNYASKRKKRFVDKQKQDAALPYKQHYKAPPEMEMCSNCGRERTKGDYWRYSKCYCGGTFQSFRGIEYK